jgi:hypothetical protein
MQREAQSAAALASVRSSLAPMDRRAHREGSRCGAGIYDRKRRERIAMRIV